MPGLFNRIFLFVVLAVLMEKKYIICLPKTKFLLQKIRKN